MLVAWTGSRLPGAWDIRRSCLDSTLMTTTISWPSRTPRLTDSPDSSRTCSITVFARSRPSRRLAAWPSSTADRPSVYRSLCTSWLRKPSSTSARTIRCTVLTLSDRCRAMSEMPRSPSLSRNRVRTARVRLIACVPTDVDGVGLTISEHLRVGSSPAANPFALAERTSRFIGAAGRRPARSLRSFLEP